MRRHHRRSHRRFSSARAYGKENPTGIEWLLIGLGTLTAAGIVYTIYEASQLNAAYAATLPAGSTPVTANEQAWLQTPAGQQAVMNLPSIFQPYASNLAAI
jgi:hypothetical protein